MPPAGSISGAPKPRTLQIIDEVEANNRGYYTGICGWFEGQQLDSGVMIRFIEQQRDGQLVFKSGEGLTARSEARAEYQELIDKIYFPLRMIQLRCQGSIIILKPVISGLIANHLARSNYG